MGAKKGKRTKRKASSSMSFQNLYSKNPIAMLGGTFALLLVVSTVMVLSSNTAQVVYSDSGSVEEQEPAQVVNAVYGKVTKIAGNSFEVRVEVGEATIPFSFTYDDDTSFSVFAYANDDDLVGSETAISSDDLAVGDKVSVYTKKAPDSTATQHAVRIVKTQ